MHGMIARYADLLQARKEYGDGVKIDGIIPGQLTRPSECGSLSQMSMTTMAITPESLTMNRFTQPQRTATKYSFIRYTLRRSKALISGIEFYRLHFTCSRSRPRDKNDCVI
jgi:hypothetical protein